MKLGVIITLYNNQKTVLKALKSVCEHDYLDKLKIVLIDDCSSDDTLTLIKNSKYYKNIKIIHKNFENLGISKSRNKAIKLCNDTDYLTFIDGDDYLKDNFFRYIFNQSFNDDLILFDFDNILDDKKESVMFYEKDKILTDKIIIDYIYKFLEKPKEKKLFSTCWAKLYKTEKLFAFKNYFNEKLHICEDGDFIIRFLNNINKVKYFKFSMYCHTITKGPKNLNKLTFATNYEIKNQISFLHIVKEIKKYLINKGENFQKFKKLMFHCLGSFVIIYTIRSCIRVTNIKNFLQVYLFWKKTYNSRRFKKIFNFYSSKKANGNLILPLLIRKKMYFLSIIYALLIARKRYIKI